MRSDTMRIIRETHKGKDTMPNTSDSVQVENIGLTIHILAVLAFGFIMGWFLLLFFFQIFEEITHVINALKNMI